MLERIPEELFIQILVKLPVEDLVRCKPWYSLISSPSFIAFHANTTPVSATDDLLLVKHGFEANSYSLHFDNESFGIYKSLDLPIYTKKERYYFRAIGCFNGVLCLSDDQMSYTHRLILWNPSIRKVVTLPRPLVTYCSHGPFDHSLGFSFCPVKNDYKVVRVVYLEGDDCGFKLPPEVEMFELSTGSWRKADAKGFSYVIDSKTPQAFFNGAVHWVGSKWSWEKGSHGNVIVSFDMDKEEFGVIELPDSPAGQLWPHHLYVAVLGGALSLIQHTESGDGVTCCIWVLEQYGVSETWMKYHTIELGAKMEMFGFLKSGDILMTAGTHSYRLDHGFCDSFEFADLLCCDLKSKQIKDLEVGGQKISIYVDYFVESLALLGVKRFEDGARASIGSTSGVQLKKKSKTKAKMGRNRQVIYTSTAC